MFIHNFPLAKSLSLEGLISKTDSRFVCHSLCLASSFTDLTLYYVLNLSYVFDIFDIFAGWTESKVS